MRTIPDSVIEIRRDLCHECTPFANDPCASCVHGHWGPYVLCEEDHQAPPEMPPWTPHQEPSTDNGGAGTELKRLLKKIGIEAVGQCQCNARAAEMDRRGPDWCEENINLIVGWLREEAERRRMPFIDAGARIVVRMAIRKARKGGVDKTP